MDNLSGNYRQDKASWQGTPSLERVKFITRDGECQFGSEKRLNADKERKCHRRWTQINADIRKIMKKTQINIDKRYLNHRLHRFLYYADM
jgi:hypothetical protein